MQLSEQIITWIKKEVKSSRKEGVVLGLSGGIDSAVVAVLSKMALGSDKVLGLILPCKSHSQDEKFALKLVQDFGIKTEKVSLDAIFETFLKSCPNGTDMARANLKPRLRMCTLYYFANTLNYLVAGTGNKSEAMIGYFTKYGDGGVDILPLGELLKTDVRIIAKELNIPEEIINRPPSAGLWHDQTDEGEIGITYEELDKTIAAMKNKKTKGIPKETLAKVKKMIADSEHKRVNIPVFSANKK